MMNFFSSEELLGNGCFKHQLGHLEMLSIQRFAKKKFLGVNNFIKP